MARSSWFDANTEHPMIQERVQKLKIFTDALQDGVITSRELAAQSERLTAAMKSLESTLNDETHAHVTTVLVELSAYNVMRTLHELQAQHARMAFGKE